VYTAEAFLYQGGSLTSRGDVKVYIPTEPELLTGEVLIGREILNSKAHSIILDMKSKQTLIEIP
jgi:hypothetical protein